MFDHSRAFIFFYWIFFTLAGDKDNHKNLDYLHFKQNQPQTLELTALERLEEPHISLNIFYFSDSN